MSPREIYEKYSKSVVLVFGTDGSVQGSAGTGSIISRDGEVITNAHVVAKNGRTLNRLFVYLKPDKLTGSTQQDLRHRYRATLIDIDLNLDLALLRMIDPPDDLRPIDFVNPRDVGIGDPVVAIGHPETGGLWTLTTGTISAVVANFQGKRGKNVFQTDASVNRGNSGGPLLNAYGQMVGINTCISRRADDGLAITDINFSLQSSVAVEWMKRRDVLHLAYVKPFDSRVPSLAETTRPRKPATESSPIEVVEPEQGEEVADDPEFSAAANRAYLATRKAQEPLKVRPKHLTKVRKYELDPFVAAHLKELNELEDMMDEMSRTIEKGGKRRSRGENGLGLW